MASLISFRLISARINEPVKQIHAIPIFTMISFLLPVRNATKIFSAAFYSALKNPHSPAASFENTPIARFLLNDCGFSLHDANDICRRKPDLLAYKSYDNSQQSLLFLRDKGFNEIGIRKIFSKNPTLLRYSFQDNVKPKVEFLEKIGLTGQQLRKAISRESSIFSLSISRTLEPRVCFLQSVLDPDLADVVLNPESDKFTGKLVSNRSLTASASVISKNPRILKLPMKILVEVVKDVEGMGIEKGSKAFARSILQLSQLNRVTFKRKMEKLRELGFTEEEGAILVKKYPQLLGSSEDKLRQNLKFLVEEWKLPRDAILNNPVALKLSVEKRLKPRLNVLRMMNKSLKKALSYPPVRYIKMSKKDFHLKVVGRFAD